MKQRVMHRNHRRLADYHTMTDVHALRELTYMFR